MVASDPAMILQVWPLLKVRDIERSVAFYRDQLGFALVGRAESDRGLFWCRLERGGSSVMLQQRSEREEAETHSRPIDLYFVCDDVDVIYQELSGRGIELAPPSVAEYGMKQLFVPEPDDHSICFESPMEGWAE